MKQLFFFAVIATTFFACDTIDVYEQTKAFPSHSWVGKEKLSFNFSITDTTALYNIFAVIRHEDAYHFNNLWLNVTTITPDKTVTEQKVNLLLGNNNGWLGTNMDDIVEHRVLLTKFPVKLKAGQYNFSIQQIMREDPLQNMLNAGIRVEKAVK
ncbi:MAG: gliding motility lipoprotein GldH [Panacibacter sp.]